MPLSEEELRLLEQMERALVEEDPKFASTLRGTTARRTARRRAIVAGVVVVLGIAVMMTGAITRVVVVGVAGFLIMLAAATIGLTAIRGQQIAAAESSRPASGHPAQGGFTVINGGRGRGSRLRRSRATSSSGSFMERMEERWRRRRDEGGRF